MEIKNRDIRIDEAEKDHRPSKERVKELRNPPIVRRIQACLAGVNPETLYKTSIEDGSPCLESLTKMLSNSLQIDPS